MIATAARPDDAGRPEAQGPPPLAAPPPPPVAREVFGTRLPLVEHYAGLLASDGVERGLLGPRETPRLWERHLLNSAGLADLVEPGARVADVGSGAGLPGVVLALQRPDVSVVLVEPLLRRTTFLQDVVTQLGLANVEVRRARAEELVGELVVDVVVARAVAPLDRLAGWTLPLLGDGGRLIALKGQTAHDELRDAGPALRRLGALSSAVIGVGDEARGTNATAVVVTAGPPQRRRR